MADERTDPQLLTGVVDEVQTGHVVERDDALGAQQAEVDGRDHAHPARKDLRSRPFLDEEL